jgi:hypothetical protein
LEHEIEEGSGIFATVFQEAGKEEEGRQITFLGGLWDKFTDLLGGLGGVFKDLLGGLGNILGSIVQGIAGFIGGLFHQGGLVMHAGGLIPSLSSSGSTSTLSSSGLTGGSRYYVPRFHIGGLADDERFTINKVGERYITEEQNSWLTKIANSVKGGGSVTVNVPITVDRDNKRMISELRSEIEETAIRVIRRHS